MPSQNLPKPNLPGQLQTQAATPTQSASGSSASGGSSQPQSTTSASATTSPPAQTVFVAPAKPAQAQVVPPGLSRENPGGTPPKMTVTAPANNLAQAQAATPTTISAPSPASSAPKPVATPKPPAATANSAALPTRPSGPLSQLSLNPNPAPSAAGQATSPTSSASSLTTPIATAPVSTTPIVAAANSSPASSAPKQAATPAPAQAVTPEPSKPKKFSLPKPILIVGGLVLALVLGLLLFNLFSPKTSSTPPGANNNTGNPSNAGGSTTAPTTTLTYWGLWEDSQILKEVIADFESKNPTIKIDYRKQSHRDYRERLQQAIASGSGPDVFRFHVTWVPMLTADLSPLPASVMSTTEYKETFYPTAFNNLQSNGQIMGIPLMYDGLALLYNKEMLRTANTDVPKTWAELRAAASKLTVPANPAERQSGNITRAGLAIGNAGNVDHFSDILALLIIQNGGNPAEVNSQYVRDAITFYTNFVKQDKVWSERLANSTTAFARGDVAMIFAPSWRIHEIRNMNQELDFGVANLPQLDSDNPVTWATFWAEGVSSKSRNKDAAWLFLKHMSSPETLRKFYTDASAYREFGEIFPRTDMASELATDELLSAYLEDAPLAKTWYMASFTHDNGINDQVIKYYEDAVTAVLSGTTTERAIEAAASGVNSVLAKYNFK